MEEVIAEDGRYPPEAYAFLHDGLAKAVKAVHGRHGTPRHVTGQELCHALRDLAIERWGHLAQTVLAKWNIHQTMDFGNMVYLLIDAGFMKKTEQDSMEDFRDVYAFEDAFADEGDFELKE